MNGLNSHIRLPNKENNEHNMVINMGIQGSVELFGFGVINILPFESLN